MIDHALTYAARSWHVFPVRPRGKVPATANGQNDATTDVGQVTAWWTRWPDANIGIHCGPSGLVVLDVDGPDGLDSLARHPGPVPATITAHTGRGAHFYYRVPDGEAARPNATRVDGWPGLDVRSNGYVIAPPSIHPSGAVYRWQAGHERLDPVDCPTWLLAVKRPASRPVLAVPVAARDGYVGTRYGLAALRGVLRELQDARPGCRHHRLVAATFRTAELAAAGHVDGDEARRLLRAVARTVWADEAGGEAEVDNTIADVWCRRGGVAA